MQLASVEDRNDNDKENFPSKLKNRSNGKDVSLDLMPRCPECWSVLTPSLSAVVKNEKFNIDVHKT